MARTPSTLPGGPRLSDYLSLGVIAQVFPMPAVLTALEQSKCTSIRRRRLPAEVMVYYVLTLCLFRSVSTREVLRCLMDGFRLIRPESPFAVSNKSSISRARTRLGVAPFHQLRQSSVHWLSNESTPGAWYCGRRLVGIDGSTLSLPDEKGNREFFGLPGCSRGQTAFPKLRISMLLELGTRAPFAWCAGPYKESEQTQAKELLSNMGPGMLLLADRGYTGFPLWFRAKKTGADLLWRARSQPQFPVKETYEDGSWRSVFRGKGTDNTCEVRVIDYTLKQEDATIYRLVTTMLDPKEAPADKLAALYHERWEIETAYDEVKTHMLGPGAMLRSKTPDLVQQEFEGLMLAYYAVRALITKAAHKAAEDADRLSFVHTVNVLQRRIQQPGVFPPEHDTTGRD